jgi:hypothetical protein
MKIARAYRVRSTDRHPPVIGLTDYFVDLALAIRRSLAGAATKLRAAQDTVNAGKSVGGAPLPSASHEPCRSRVNQQLCGPTLVVDCPSTLVAFHSAQLVSGAGSIGSAVFRSIRLITRSIAAML